MVSEIDNKSIVLFDGQCGLCNRSVKFILKKERAPYLLLSPLQSEKGKSLLNQFQLKDKADSIVYIKNNKAYLKSGAVLRLCLQLKGLWPLMIIFIIVPTFIRDAIYDYIAKNRIKWFGTADYCEMMTAETRGRFRV